MKKKKLLTALIVGTLACLASATLFTACGGKSSSSSELEFALSADGTYYNVRSIGTYSKEDVVIPATYKGLPVKKILPCAFAGNNITSVVIPEGVTSIGANAFDSSSLKNITIPDSVTTIDSNIFGDFCYNLQYTEKNGLNYLGNSNNPYVYLAGVANEYADLHIENTCKFIGYKALERNTLTKIDIPDSVTNIGDYAFLDCQNLKSITIPKSVTHIGVDAFGNSLESFGNLGNVYISNIESWCNISFDGIISRAFNLYVNNELVTELNIPDGITSINPYAFAGCYKLTNVNIPYSIENIGKYAFFNCKNLTSIIIPDGVKSIGKGAFLSCQNLTSIIIPDSVTQIDEKQDFNSSNLQYTIKDGAKYLGNPNNPYLYLIDAESKDSTTVTINDACKFISPDAFSECSNLEYSIKDGVKYLGNSNNPYIYLAAIVDKTTTSVNIENTCKFIGYNAFYGCINLQQIVIPDSITNIGNSAFTGCTGLVNLIIPDSVRTIGDSAFADCRSLTSIKLSNKITQINKNTFSGCSSLTEITIPDGVTEIGMFAFDSANLRKVVIPDSVTIINSDAFIRKNYHLKIYYKAENCPIGSPTFRYIWGYTGE